MPNSLRKNDNRESGPETREASVAPSPKNEAQALDADLVGRAVGEASHDAPRQLTDPEVFDILVKAIRELEDSGKVPTAAGVSARMRIVDKDFSLTKTRFSTFRDATKAAEKSQIVESTRASSDYILRLTTPRDYHGMTLRPDLWHGIQDWTPDIRYEFDRVTRRTKVIESGYCSPTSMIVPSADKALFLNWIEDFGLGNASEVAEITKAALADVDPIASFHRALRDRPAAKRQWNRQLRTNVLSVASKWAVENGIPQMDIFQTPATSSADHVEDNSQDSTDDDLRRRIMVVLEAMPVHELLRLPIPLEYSLNR